MTKVFGKSESGVIGVLSTICMQIQEYRTKEGFGRGRDVRNYSNSKFSHFSLFAPLTFSERLTCCLSRSETKLFCFPLSFSCPLSPLSQRSLPIIRFYCFVTSLTLRVLLLFLVTSCSLCRMWSCDEGERSGGKGEQGTCR